MDVFGKVLIPVTTVREWLKEGGRSILLAGQLSNPEEK